MAGKLLVLSFSLPLSCSARPCPLNDGIIFVGHCSMVISSIIGLTFRLSFYLVGMSPNLQSSASIN